MSTTPVTEIADRPVQGSTRKLNLVIALICIAGFVVIAALVLTGKTQTFDDHVLVLLRDPVNPSVPVGATYLGEAVRDVTSLGGFVVLILVTVSSIVFLRLSGDVRVARFLGVAVIAGFVVSVALKSMFARPRPDIVPHLAGFTMSSFPSAHAMMSAIIYPLLAWIAIRTVEQRSVRVFVLTLSLLLSVAIGLSRVYVGVHYPSDVLAGWFAGYAWVIGCVLLAPRFIRQESIVC